MSDQSFSIKSYVNANLFVEIGIGTWPVEDQEEFLSQFGAVIQMRIVKRMLENITDEQKGTLDALLSEEPVDDQKLYAFLMKDLPSFQAIADEEIARYKKELIDKYNELSD